MRNSIRRSSGRPALRSGMAFCNIEGAAHRVDHAAKLDDQSVAGALNHPTVARRDGRIKKIAAQRSEPRQRPLLVDANESAVADYIGREDRCKLPLACSDATSVILGRSTIVIACHVRIAIDRGRRDVRCPTPIIQTSPSASGYSDSPQRVRRAEAIRGRFTCSVIALQPALRRPSTTRSKSSGFL